MDDVTASYGRPFEFITFFGHFHTFFDYSCLNCCISTKLSLIISNQYWYAKMSDVTASYVMPLIFITFFRILHKIDEYSCLKCCISTKLLQIVCLINTFMISRYNYKLRKVPWFDWVLENFIVWNVALHQAFVNLVVSLWK